MIQLLFLCLAVVLSAGGEAAEGREAKSAAETWEPDEGESWRVWEQHQRAAAAAGERLLHTCLCSIELTSTRSTAPREHQTCSSVPNDLLSFFISEWKVSPADWEWDSEAQTFGWTTQPAAEGLERSPETPEKGTYTIIFNGFIGNTKNLFLHKKQKHCHIGW